MSNIVQTEFGRLRSVQIDGERVWCLECPGCGQWGELDDDQLNGRVSVDHATDGCSGGYHETHNFALAVAAEETKRAFAPPSMRPKGNRG